MFSTCCFVKMSTSCCFVQLLPIWACSSTLILSVSPLCVHAKQDAAGPRSCSLSGLLFHASSVHLSSQRAHQSNSWKQVSAGCNEQPLITLRHGHWWDASGGGCLGSVCVRWWGKPWCKCFMWHFISFTVIGSVSGGGSLMCACLTLCHFLQVSPRSTGRLVCDQTSPFRCAEPAALTGWVKWTIAKCFCSYRWGELLYSHPAVLIRRDESPLVPLISVRLRYCFLCEWRQKQMQTLGQCVWTSQKQCDSCLGFRLGSRRCSPLWSCSATRRQVN